MKKASKALRQVKKEIKNENKQLTSKFCFRKLNNYVFNLEKCDISNSAATTTTWNEHFYVSFSSKVSS